MMLFLAHEPNAENERDGMSQRIKWIDEQFRDVPRVILHISLKRNMRRRRFIRSSVLAVEEVNLLIHFPRILYLALRSDIVYVHSCLYALRGLPLYFLGLRIITDMHGIVPEEQRIVGKSWLSRVLLFRVLSVIEIIVVKRSAVLVFVTNAMRIHFKEKYSLGDDANTYIIPILTREAPLARLSFKDPTLVIYAGGLQAWQRVDKMLDVVEHAKGWFRYLFLTGDADNLSKELNRRGITKVQVDSVPKSIMYEHYERASLGLILRADSLINRVACPTKLVEYLWSGIIPIVEQPFIGDFKEMGYKYILMDDFVKGQLPGAAELDNMRERNHQIARELEKLSVAEITCMRERYIET